MRWLIFLFLVGLASVALAQLGGGVVGLLGEYSRSERRVRGLLADHAITLEAPVEAV